MIQGRKIKTPLFDIPSKPTIKLSDIKKMFFLDEVCPVCNARVRNILSHAILHDDIDHIVLTVHSS